MFEVGETYDTKDGLKATVISTSAREVQGSRIVALVHHENYDSLRTYTLEGKWDTSSETSIDSHLDLVPPLKRGDIIWVRDSFTEPWVKLVFLERLATGGVLASIVDHRLDECERWSAAWKLYSQCID